MQRRQFIASAPALGLSAAFVGRAPAADGPPGLVDVEAAFDRLHADRTHAAADHVVAVVDRYFAATWEAAVRAAGLDCPVSANAKLDPRVAVANRCKSSRVVTPRYVWDVAMGTGLPDFLPAAISVPYSVEPSSFFVRGPGDRVSPAGIAAHLVSLIPALLAREILARHDECVVRAAAAGVAVLPYEVGFPRAVFKGDGTGHYMASLFAYVAVHVTA